MTGDFTMHKVLAQILAVLVSLAASCTPSSREGIAGDPVSSSASSQKMILQEDGHCHQREFPEGSNCYLSSLREQHCSDCGTREKLYALGYRVGTGPRPWGFRLGIVRIPAGRAAEFEAFATRNYPAKCSGTIILPPCNPDATSMNVDIIWPSWVRFEQ